MEKRSVRHNLFRIILAIVFICFGIIALGNNIGWWDIDDLFLTWWPLILILLGFITIFAPGGSWGGGVFLIILGIVLLLHTHGIYDISDLIWPAMLILVGFLVWPKKHSAPKPCPPGGEPRDTGEDHTFNINTLFQSQRETIIDKQLSGGHGTAVFGNLELDLRQSVPRTGAYMEISAVFGKVRLSVPQNWNITKHGGPVFGSIDDRRRQSAETAYTHPVTIEMNAVFGNVELTD